MSLLLSQLPEALEWGPERKGRERLRPAPSSCLHLQGWSEGWHLPQPIP